MAKPTKWETDTSAEHSAWYIKRFRELAEQGADLGGEARLVDAMVSPGSRVLDAGCGTGRVAAVLHQRGHAVVGVDADPLLVQAASEDHDGPTWIVADLSELDLALQGETEPFDAVVVAGNVMAFVADGTEVDVLRRLAAHLAPDGFIVIGFGLDRGYSLAGFDTDVVAAGLAVEQRFATWDLKPWHEESTFAVSVLRHAPS